MRVFLNIRFFDVLFYMLSCKILEKSRSVFYYGFGDVLFFIIEKCLVNIIYYKKKFVFLLVKVGKVE